MSNEKQNFELSSDHGKSARIRLYIDEIKETKDRNGREWIYIGVVAIKDCHHRQLMNVLFEQESVLHFDDIKGKSISSPKLKSAGEWLGLVVSDKSPVHFKILGIAMDQLNKECFGDEKVSSRVYHRFLRSAVMGLISGIFHKDIYSSVEVVEVFHDRTNHAKHWETMTIDKINEKNSRVNFECDSIKFINSDHKANDGHNEHSRIIQLVDIILGSFRYVMDAPEYKKNKGAEYLAKVVHSFIAELNNQQWPFKYRYKCGISYFPKKALTIDEILYSDERYKVHFFDSKELLWHPQGHVQEVLDL